MDVDSPAGVAFLAWALILMLGGTAFVVWPRGRRRRRRLTPRRRKD